MIHVFGMEVLLILSTYVTRATPRLDQRDPFFSHPKLVAEFPAFFLAALFGARFPETMADGDSHVTFMPLTHGTRDTRSSVTPRDNAPYERNSPRRPHVDKNTLDYRTRFFVKGYIKYHKEL